MPIRFLSTVVPRPAEKHIAPRSARRRGFDIKVAQVAPIIAKLQNAHCLGVQEIADELNRLGVPAPSGRNFSFGTTYRVLKRGAELKICSGPLSLDKAKEHVQRKKAALIVLVMQKYQK